MTVVLGATTVLDADEPDEVRTAGREIVAVVDARDPPKDDREVTVGAE